MSCFRAWHTIISLKVSIVPYSTIASIESYLHYANIFFLIQKRLSIPATVSRVLKYIPELQQQVEGLIQKRDELLSKMSKQENVILQEEKQLQSTARRSGSSLSAVSTSRLSDTEVAIQISTVKSTHNIISRILQSLEEDGLEILNASTFESSGGRVFYNLQLQVLFILFCWNFKRLIVYILLFYLLYR